MQNSKIVTDGYARDEALRRSKGPVRQAQGLRPAPTPEADKPEEPKPADESPSE